MKNLIFLLIAFLLLISATPLTLKKQDQAQYNRYLIYCNTLVKDTVNQFGSAGFEHRTIIQNDIHLGNGNVLKKGTVRYVWKIPFDTIWYPVIYKDYKIGSIMPAAKPRSYIIDQTRVFLERKKVYRCKQEKPTLRRFYEWWLPTHQN